MSFLGTACNKALNKSINIYLATSGRGFKRIVESIEQKGKNTALCKTKAAFEAGKVRGFETMKTEKIVITNLRHTSPGDYIEHYTLMGLDANGEDVKGGHRQQDESKQTVAVLCKVKALYFVRLVTVSS